MTATNLRLAAVALSLTPTLYLAWGFDGHRIVGEIASHYLTPEAKAAVRPLNSRLTEALAASTEG
ncbi:MAG: hypothetical protein IID37_16470 [Planctomycetes bacterium]|nr:hypothetical protein [Planctomycetota bacterium]